MTDRELLELAAKAAGIERGADRTDCGISVTLSDGRRGHLPRWNPLTDDGDALRLAVKLRLWVQANEMNVEAECWQDAIGETTTITEYADPLCDREAATRRAIVRAAAGLARAALSQGEQS